MPAAILLVAPLMERGGDVPVRLAGGLLDVGRVEVAGESFAVERLNQSGSGAVIKLGDGPMPFAAGEWVEVAARDGDYYARTCVARGTLAAANEIWDLNPHDDKERLRYVLGDKKGGGVLCPSWCCRDGIDMRRFCTNGWASHDLFALPSSPANAEALANGCWHGSVRCQAPATLRLALRRRNGRTARQLPR